MSRKIEGNLADRVNFRGVSEDFRGVSEKLRVSGSVSWEFNGFQEDTEDFQEF